MESQQKDKMQLIFDFSEINQNLKTLVAEKQRVNDMLTTFTQIDLDVKILVDKTESNLKQTAEMKAYMVQRLKALDSLEAKWTLLIERVGSVMDELERVLKQS